MLPFRVEFKSGEPIYEQVVFAAKKALVAGQLRVGDRFPSVRQLSVELKINPNTAHKVVATLMREGLLESQPGIGTIVADYQPASSVRSAMLSDEIDHLVVESLKFSLSLDDVQTAIRQAWDRLSRPKKPHSK